MLTNTNRRIDQGDRLNFSDIHPQAKPPLVPWCLGDSSVVGWHTWLHGGPGRAMSASEESARRVDRVHRRQHYFHRHLRHERALHHHRPLRDPHCDGDGRVRGSASGLSGWNAVGISAAARARSRRNNRAGMTGQIMMVGLSNRPTRGRRKYPFQWPAT